MTQISRPFVIALAAVLLFAGVWFVALKPHTSSTTETTPSAPAPAPAPSGAAQEKANAAPSHVDHTSTPGVEGLTKDVNKAHGAVATTQANGKRVEQKAAQASGGASSASTAASTSPSTHAAAPSTATAPKTSTVPKTATAPKSGAAPRISTVPKTSVHTAAGAAAARRAQEAQAKSASEAEKASKSAGKESSSRVPSGQALVESALKEDKMVVLLFWNPHSAEDQVVHLSVGLIAGVHEIFEALSANPKTSSQLKHSGGSLGKIAVFEAGPKQVASFGSFTRTVPVLQTPTVLIVNPLGQITAIPGYTETRAINQRLGESRKTFEESAKKASQHAAK
jgi:hypothetical protein